MTDRATILLVDDNDIDVEATQRIFKKNNIDNPVMVAQNGQQALDCLQGHDGQKKLEQPYVILLDLNMPRMNGIEFLKSLRADPNTRDSRVFVLTTSDRDVDRSAASCYQIAGYIVKAELEAALPTIFQPPVTNTA